jgi:hypothetical protein
VDVVGVDKGVSTGEIVIDGLVVGSGVKLASRSAAFASMLAEDISGTFSFKSETITLAVAKVNVRDNTHTRKTKKRARLLEDIMSVAIVNAMMMYAHSHIVIMI